MVNRSRGWVVALAACLMLAFAGVAAAQYSVVAVMPDGTVILRSPAGVRSYQVPAGTTFNADGKPDVAVADLKPGMQVTGFESGIASWKSTNVMVHEELNAEVVAAAGNSLLIKGAKGVEKYQWKESSEITIVKDGKVVDASSIHVGDRITGMIVQKSVAPPPAAPPVAAAAPPPAAPPPAPTKVVEKPAPAPAPAPAAAPAPAPEKKLPKTASEVPAAGLLGALALAAGAGLTAIRKSRSAK